MEREKEKEIMKEIMRERERGLGLYGVYVHTKSQCVGKHTLVT